MKISELISKLQEIKDKHGDYNVYRVYDDGEIHSMDDEDIELCRGCVEIY